jgi:hypothetical protein
MNEVDSMGYEVFHTYDAKGTIEVNTSFIEDPGIKTLMTSGLTIKRNRSGLL